jgi:hypothetical protein
MRTTIRRTALALLAVAGTALPAAPAPAQPAPVLVGTGQEWSEAFTDDAVAAITLTADVELDCPQRAPRPAGAVALAVDGGGHAITDGCVDPSSFSIATASPVSFEDVELAGSDEEFGTVLMGAEVHLRDVVVVVRNGGHGVEVQGRSTLADVTVQADGDFGVVASALSGPVTIERTTITGTGSGIRMEAHGGNQPAVIRDVTVDVGSLGIRLGHPTTIQRTSVRAGETGLFAAEDTSRLEDSTVVLDPARPGAEPPVDAAVTVVASTLVVDQSTVLGAPAVRVDAQGAAVLHASVLDGGAGPACLVADGTLASDGDVVATDDTCVGIGAGPGDRIQADVGLEPYEPATGLARPTPGGPLVDAVADCTSTADQRGVSRPQGPACDIGAVELEVAVPPTTVPGPTTPGGTAPPATPIPGPARFTG